MPENTYRAIKGNPNQVGISLLDQGYKKLPDADKGPFTFINDSNKTFWFLNESQLEDAKRIVSQRENKEVKVEEDKI